MSLLINLLIGNLYLPRQCPLPALPSTCGNVVDPYNDSDFKGLALEIGLNIGAPAPASPLYQHHLATCKHVDTLSCRPPPLGFYQTLQASMPLMPF